MKGLTYYIDRLYANPKGTIIPNDVKRILVCRPNGRLGNQLLITPLIQELSETFPNCTIDLFVKGNLASFLFENYNNVDRIIRLPGKPFKELGKYIGVWWSLRKYKYDIAINIVPNSSSGRLSACLTRSRFKFLGDLEDERSVSHTELQHMAKFPVYSIRKILSQFSIPNKERPIQEMDIKLSQAELANGKKVLESIVTNPEKETICIYTFATGGKCYSKTWWEEVYKKLNSAYAEKYNILEVLPKENISQINFKAPSWYSLDIREMGAVIANTKIFISADCGVMHLASAVHTPTVGLFSSNNINRYAPYNNGSIAINTNTTGAAELIEVIEHLLHKH